MQRTHDHQGPLQDKRLGLEGLQARSTVWIRLSFPVLTRQHRKFFILVMQPTEPLQLITRANFSALASQWMAGPSFCHSRLFDRGLSAPIPRCFCDRILLGRCRSGSGSEAEMARLSLSGLLTEAREAQVVEEKGPREVTARDSLEEE